VLGGIPNCMSCSTRIGGVDLPAGRTERIALLDRRRSSDPNLGEALAIIRPHHFLPVGHRGLPAHPAASPAGRDHRGGGRGDGEGGGGASAGALRRDRQRRGCGGSGPPSRPRPPSTAGGRLPGWPQPWPRPSGGASTWRPSEPRWPSAPAVGCTRCEQGLELALVAEVLTPAIRNQHRIGRIGVRRSRTASTSYVSNGCVACDALLGGFPLAEQAFNLLVRTAAQLWWTSGSSSRQR